MRLIPLLVSIGLLLTASCNGALRQSQSDCKPPKVGQVLAVCSGSIVVSLGAKDGIRPGDTMMVTRGSTPVTGILIHEVKQTQAVGTAMGASRQGDAVPGDRVVLDQD